MIAVLGSSTAEGGTSGATYLSRLGQLRDKALAAGVPTFFMGTAPKDLSDSERFELADWNQQMRGSFNSCWVPASIHLNDAGHRVIFNQAVAVIEPYLCMVMDCH